MYTKEIQQYLEKHGFGAFNPKAVLFDMDGVLYDSMPNHAYSWHKAMKELGLEMSEEEAFMREGMRGVEVIKILAREQWGREVSDDEAEEMYLYKSRIFASLPKAEVMPGVKELQRKIKADGLKIVVVTGSGQKTLLDKLATEFEGLIVPELIVCSYDVTRGKPDPEPYLIGMQKAGVNPWEAIVVENAPLGVRSAVAANIFTIGVNTGPLPNKMLTDEGASLVFNKMQDLADNWGNIMRNA